MSDSLNQSTYLPSDYGQGYDPKKIIAMVVDRRKASMDYVRSTYQKTSDWYNAFQGFPVGRVASYLNEVTIPLVFATIMSDVARKSNSIFGAWPIVKFRGFPDGSEGIALKNELLVSLQLKDAKSFRKSIDFFIQADLNGTAIAEVGWTHLERLRQFRHRILDQVVEVKGPVVEFDGPNWRVKDLLDFLPEPGKTHIDDMGWYIIRYFVDFDDLLEQNSGDGTRAFSDQALRELAQTQLPVSLTSQDEIFAWNRARSFQEFSTNTNMSTRAGKPVEIWEMRGSVPMECAQRDGIRQRVITIANGRVLLRDDPDKLLLGRHRVVTYSPTPDPYHFVGIGKAQIAEPLQSAAGRLVNQKLDALDLFIKPMFIAAQGVLSGQNLYTKPGRIFQANAKARNLQDVIMPLIPNLGGLQAAMLETEFLDRLIQKGTGIDESAVMGIERGGSDRQTAHEFAGRQEAAMTRLAMESMLASSEFVEPMAELFRDMNKTMLSLPKMFSMIGSKALINGNNGMPNPPESGIIMDPNELNHDWRAQAFGPMFMLTQSAQRADALQLAQIMQSNPIWIQSLNWIAMARKIFSLYNWDPDEMMLQQLPIIQQLAAQMGTSPQQAVAASSQNPLAAYQGAGGQGPSGSAPSGGPVE